MNDDSDAEEKHRQWAYIFNALGKDTLRELLFDASVDLHETDAEHRVIEFGQEKALDVTDHYDQLEKQVQ